MKSTSSMIWQAWQTWKAWISDKSATDEQCKLKNFVFAGMISNKTSAMLLGASEGTQTSMMWPWHVRMVHKWRLTMWSFQSPVLSSKNLPRSERHSHPLIYMVGVRSEDLVSAVDFLFRGEAKVNQENKQNNSERYLHQARLTKRQWCWNQGWRHKTHQNRCSYNRRLFRRFVATWCTNSVPHGEKSELDYERSK